LETIACLTLFSAIILIASLADESVLSMTAGGWRAMDVAANDDNTDH
jgi:hypothetical protein